MDSWRQLFLLLSVFCMLTVVNSLNLQFDDVVGDVGSNDTTLRCAFEKNTNEIVQSLALSARNVSTNKFTEIAIFVPNIKATLLAGGEYLSGRVILSNLTSLSTDVNLTFKDLQCDMETSYRCKILYIDNVGSKSEEKNINLTVAVNPSVPNIVLDDVSLCEGDNVTFSCTGNIGYPPRTFIWQKLQENAASASYRNVPTESTIVEDSCFYNGTSNLTIQVSDDDNNAVIRCSVNNSNDEMYYHETQAIDVLYKVRKPSIYKQPMDDEYLEGPGQIKLTCKGRGNPQPSYSWFKDRNMDEILNSSNTLYITEVITNNSGMYRCNASNNISGIEYTQSTIVTITIVKERTSTPTPTTTGRESTQDANKEQSEDITLVIGIVVGVVLFVIVVVIIGCYIHRKKRSNPNNKEIFRQHTVRNVEGYDSVHLDKGNGIRDTYAESQSHQNLAYSPNDTEKTAEENINKENDTQGLDTRNEYASVNEVTKIKNRIIGQMPVENQHKSNQDDMEDPYTESKDTTYAHLGEKHQHKTAENTELYDKAGELTDRL